MASFIGLNFGRETENNTGGAVVIRGPHQSIHLSIGHEGAVEIPVKDAAGDAIDLDESTLRLIIQDYRAANVATLENGAIARESPTVTVNLSGTTTAKRRTLRWYLFDITGGGLVEVAAGYFPVY
ncbi:hypothetical protein [Aureliella helgolandensis]|uniref:Uncharacterized protein n=1 Tax=Aureliella helgolandensis TaxID=2527968 RepID=A0A518G732_9BACT|nr:hypothetical protein [Aureliella helgolandensis]QDV24400.1 hypothetical protein Q31a_27170 [Aureliella helgolandensis]